MKNNATKLIHTDVIRDAKAAFEASGIRNTHVDGSVERPGVVVLRAFAADVATASKGGDILAAAAGCHYGAAGTFRGVRRSSGRNASGYVNVVAVSVG
jgi:hypothetical protein